MHRTARYFAILFALALPLSSLAQDCIDYSTYLHWAGSVETPGNANAIIVSGELAYIADGAFGLQIVDISNPDQPQIIGSVDTPGTASGLDRQENYAYVADLDEGLAIIDVSIPTDPVVLTSYDTPGNARSVAVSSHYVFVADGWSGLLVLDVTDVAAPIAVSYKDFPDVSAMKVVTSGTRAYVMFYESEGSSSGLQIYDISTPESPVLLGTSEYLNDRANDLEVVGGLAYLSIWGGGLVILDITDPSQITTVGSLRLHTHDEVGIAVVGNTAYLASMSDGLYAVDVTDPALPEVLYHFDAPGDQTHDLAIAGDLAYVIQGEGGVRITDLSDPPNSLPIGTLSMPGRFYHVAVGGTHALIGGYKTGLQVIDISSAEEPSAVGEALPAESIYSVTINDGLAYVGTWEPGAVQIVDISDPEDPFPVGSVDIPGVAFDSSIVGSLLYVAGGDGGVFVVDVSRPSMPLAITNVSSPGSAMGITVGDGFLYVACNWGGLVIYDLSDPRLPTFLSQLQTPENAVDVLTDGDTSFVAGGRSGIHILDVSEPSTPTLLNTHATTDDAAGLALDGTSLYVTDDDAGIQLVDVSNRLVPVLIGAALTQDEVSEVVISDDYILTVGFESGLQIFPAHCPASVPVLYSGFRVWTLGRSVHAEWATVIGNSADEFRLLAGCQGREWYVPVTTSTGGHYGAVDDSPYLTNGTTAKYTLEFKSPGAPWIQLESISIALSTPLLPFHLCDAHPNPFNPRTTITYSIPQSGHVELEIYDLAGRHVSTLVSENVAAGEHQVQWNGKDDTGAQVASGVYLYQLRAGEYFETKRMVLLK